MRRRGLTSSLEGKRAAMHQPERPLWLELWMEANASLSMYVAHNGGTALFRAYVLHRRAKKAWQDDAVAQAEELRAASHDQSGRGVRWMSHGDMLAEQSEAIQTKLDAVMGDLCTVTATANWKSGEDHLPQLTAALRIWKSSAPDETRKTEIGWAVRERMLLAYCEMGSTGKYRSKTSLLDAVGASLGISRVTAGRHWNAYLASDSRQKVWAEGIEANAKRKPPSAQALAEVARALGIDAAQEVKMPQEPCPPARRTKSDTPLVARGATSKRAPGKSEWFKSVGLSKRKDRSG